MKMIKIISIILIMSLTGCGTLQRVFQHECTMDEFFVRQDCK